MKMNARGLITVILPTIARKAQPKAKKGENVGS